jgi:diguanylate cyclase (GGDEF)-like protein/PAS domain S-box-containing protein
MKKTVLRSLRDKETAVVGIDASAGGLEALQELLSNSPKNTGATYVVIQHLSPSSKRMLSQILARETKMQVKDIRRTERPRPNTVYLISTNKALIIEKGRLASKPVIETRLSKPSIDLFFQSTAEPICPHAIDVILSGTGSDEALGLRAIRAQHSHGEVEEFVQFPKGEMNMHLKNILPDKWYDEAQALILQSIKKKTVIRGIKHPCRTEQGEGFLTLIARTRFDEASIPSLLLLSFEWQIDKTQTTQHKSISSDNKELQYQLNLSNEHLEALLEEHNTTVKGMNTLYEELQTSNEELQSTNEELESSTEELQSTNEELITVNEELMQKNIEAENLSKYLESIQNSIPVALLIVSPHLQLQRFNNAAAKIFDLDSSKIGKSLVSLPSKIAIERILPPLRSALSAGTSHKTYREIVNNEQRYYQLNINGFCNTEEKIGGAIITLLDISEQCLAEKYAERSEMQLLSMMNHSPTLIYQKDLRGQYLFVNDTFTAFFSLTREQCIGKTDEQLFDKDLAKHFRKRDIEAQNNYKHYQALEEKVHFNNADYWFLGNRTPLMTQDDIVYAVIWNAINITERKHMELEAEDARKELRLQYHLRDSLLHQRADYVAAIDKEFNYLMVTPAYSDIIRELYNVDTKEGDNLKIVLQKNTETLKWHIELWDRALNGERFTDIFEYNRTSGESRYLKYEMIPVRHHDNSILGAAVFARDITIRKKAELALKYSEQVYRSLIKKTDTGYVTLDLEGRVLDANPEYVRLSGFRNLPQIQGRSPLDWTHPEDIETHQEELKNVIAGGDMKNLQLRFRDLGGRITPVESNATILETLKGKQIIIWCRDIKKRVEQQRKIEQMAYYDSLTGLENRMMLTQQLKKAIQLAERHDGRLAVMFVDLDRFKHINDSLGHEVGDEVLQRVAERLKSSVRASDTVGRLGGDEFLCVVSELTDVEHDSICISQKLLRALSQPYKIGAHELHLSASIGISIYPDNGTDATTLIKNADAAMYQIKENGRDDYVFYSPAMNDRSHAFVSMGNKLRSALAKGQLELHFQPQYRLSNSEMVAAEALLRWRHPEQGMIPPATFIPVAEDIGLMKALGHWILEKTCVQLQQWQLKKLPVVPISINVSARQCRDKWVEEEVLHCLEKHNIHPKLLQLEFTESTLIANSQEARTMLRKLKTLGIKTAIDDFGTGYSSLSYLKQFPIDKLKIDKSFILDIGRDEGDETIVAAIIGLAKNLKMSVLAEGVETKEQLRFLKGLECDEAQGFYYHTALEGKRFLQLLLQRKRSNATFA